MASMTSLAIELDIASQDSDSPDLPKGSPYMLIQGQPTP
jgi:hypothetical protein